MTSTLLTPVDSSPVLNLAETSEGLEFDKHILPEGRSITYKGREVLFDRALATDLVGSFSKPLPVLLDGPLAHDVQDRDTGALRDPERWRGDVVGLRLAKDGEAPGLWGRVRFPNADAAMAVLNNGKLGVSARILEGIAEGGRKAGRVMQHLLMTMVPRVDGLSPWKAVSLALDTDEADVIDLTEAEYDEEASASVADDEITDEEINRALADAAAELEEPVTQTADLAVEDRDAIDLAISRAEEAERNAQTALAQLAQANWRGDRLQYAQAGVPAADLDLAEPLLSLPGSQVIDLAEGDPVDPCAIVRGLLDNRKGTIDLSDPKGHGGDDEPEILNPNSEHGDPRAKVGSPVWPA